MKDYSQVKSVELFRQAQQTVAGGVNSVARSPMAGFVPAPPYFAYGEGARFWDVDGNSYVDYLLGFGPLILGHRHPDQTAAVQKLLLERGVVTGNNHDLEYLAAEKIVSYMPAVDMVRFANSGTEAVMAAIRLARGFTGKTKILRFEGHYHGWSDLIHWNVRSPAGAIGLRHAPRAVPGTAGIPDEYGDALIIQPWNAPEVLERTVRRHANEIAAIITEPLMCNLGATMPLDEYHLFLRQLCDQHDILLIFDEVITGFRLGLGGAQAHYGIDPDLTTMAKALGGGYPVAALGGKREIMELMARHQVSHAGTYNGNTLSLTAALTTMEILEEPGLYGRLFDLGDRLRQGLTQIIQKQGIPVVAQGVGPVLQLWFEDKPIVDYRDAISRKNGGVFPKFTAAMYKRGVLFNASQMGVWYLSTVHSQEDIDFTLEAAEDAIIEIKPTLAF